MPWWKGPMLISQFTSKVWFGFFFNSGGNFKQGWSTSYLRVPLCPQSAACCSRLSLLFWFVRVLILLAKYVGTVAKPRLSAYLLGFFGHFDLFGPAKLSADVQVRHYQRSPARVGGVLWLLISRTNRPYNCSAQRGEKIEKGSVNQLSINWNVSSAQHLSWYSPSFWPFHMSACADSKSWIRCLKL